MNIFTKFFTSIGAWIALILGAAGAFFGVYYSGKRTAKAESAVKEAQETANREVKAARDSAKLQTSTSKAVSDVQAEVNQSDSSGVSNKLRDRWTRD